MFYFHNQSEMPSMSSSNRITVWQIAEFCWFSRSQRYLNRDSIKQEFASVCCEFNRFRWTAVLVLMLYKELI